METNEPITLETLPKAFTGLQEKVNNIERLLLERSNPNPQPETDELLTVKDTAKFLSLSVPTIYGLIAKGELPVMKRSKRCYFSKIDLMNYLKAGRKKTDIETTAEADTYLGKNKRAPK